MSDIEYVNGLIIKAPHENAPDFVKAKGSIKREELIKWLSEVRGDWVNFDVKVSKGGKWYCAVDNWKPEQSQAPQEKAAPADDDIPF